MAIKAIVEGGQDLSAEEIIGLAQGTPDETDKQPFSTIKLMALGQDGKGAGSRFHIAGYQDTFISFMADGSIKVQHGRPGAGILQFERNKIGRLIGEIANTPHNLATLAAQMAAGDRQWKIMDSEQEKMVKDASKKVRVSEDTINAKKEIEAAPKPQINAEAELKNAIEMTKKVEAMENKAEKAAQTDDNQEAFKGQNELARTLADMNYGQLKQRATVSGVDKEVRDRKDLIAGIMLYEAKKSKGELNVE